MNYIRLQGRVLVLIKNASNGLKLNFRREVPNDDPLAEPGEAQYLTQALYAVPLSAQTSTFLKSILSAIGQSKTEFDDQKVLASPVGMQWGLKSGDQVELDGQWTTLNGVDTINPDRKTPLLIKASTKRV